LGLPTTNLWVSYASAEAPLEQLIQEHKVTAKLQLAALKQVGELVEKTRRIFLKNLGGRAKVN
jgi:UDP-glucose 4-epimerase